jgi:serine protease Do
MPLSRLATLALVLAFCASSMPAAQDKKPSPPAAAKGKTVEQLAEAAHKSIVVIVFAGRDGKQQGLGTGFVVGKDGLIATNLHVIGEARPINVQLSDGTRHDVVAVHASDRSMDLALIRIDAKNLEPLELGDSSKLKNGQAIVALGHPRGLKYSVVSGVVSGKRDVEGMNMIQLAIPIEQGNSGGPVLDMQGKVVGIVTMKSLVTANLGFAVPANSLKPILAKPNPILMENWLTIGALDKTEWKTVFGGRWRQRAGRIIADGMGNSFGGRSLCLSQTAPPKIPYEMAVTVKLDDEKGAAGLVFHADGQERHYGFYPSAGKLRFVRFDGADVFSWKILHNEGSEHYRPGEWNTLKVRVEKSKFICYVNGHQVLEMEDDGLKPGALGLASFRGTNADFKNFQVAERIVAKKIPDEVLGRIRKTLASLSPEKPLPAKLTEKLAPDGAASIAMLRERAKLLEEQAAQLKKLALAVHQQQTRNDLAKTLEGQEKDVDLVHAALLIARLDNEELDVEVYKKEVDRLARQAAATFPAKADAAAKLKALNKFLFEERGYHGSRVDYYTRNNSYLNEVIDDREGLPITLSVLYIEVARRVGLNVVGVPLPGQFMVRHEPPGGMKHQLVDVYAGGKLVSKEEASKTVEKITGEPIKAEHLKAITKKGIILRMLRNLANVAQQEQDLDSMLNYLDTVVAVDPQAHDERWVRAVLRWKAGVQRDSALADLDWFLKENPDGVDLERVRELRRILMQGKRE